VTILPLAPRRRAEITRTVAIAALCGLLSLGCAMHQKQVERSLDEPIDCSTAEGDIRVLQSEKAHVEEQILEGATAITPAGAVLGLLTGTERTKMQVAVGEYNQMIDERIARIRVHCGV